MSRYYDISVTLDEVRPLVWRRFLIAADVTFADLHRAIQDACGWENYHLFEFSSAAGERIAGLPDQEWDEPVVPDASTVALSALGEQDVCRYVYDFGDHWEHTVRCEGIVESEEHFHRRLVGGARAFPREDCGGIPGYQSCVAVARGGEDEESLREWLGDWDPERFDFAAARLAFDATLTRRARKASRLSAVVVRFSRSRKRYERKGVLVEEQAMEEAEASCLTDADARARRRIRDEERRREADERLAQRLTEEILRLFPGCPAERAEAIATHTAARGSGRVGRTAAAQRLDEDAVELAVVASVRHRDTNYDTLLMAGVPREEARRRVREDVRAVLDRWRRG